MSIEMQVRKIVVYSEHVLAEAGRASEREITRVVAAGVIENPFAGGFEADLSQLFDWGEQLGQLLMQRALPCLPRAVESYGKAALVGSEGDVEHAHALLHPKLGKAMRAPMGGSEALIPSSAKVSAAGAVLDIPLGHKDNAWSFNHFDSISLCVVDAPRPRELLMAVALADGGRVNARVGQQRLAQ